MQGCVFNQKPIPSELIDQLTESSLQSDNSNALQRRLRDDGYIFLRNALDLDDALSARQEILQALVDVGAAKILSQKVLKPKQLFHSINPLTFLLIDQSIHIKAANMGVYIVMLVQPMATWVYHLAWILKQKFSINIMRPSS